jgi:hypothetical protein
MADVACLLALFSLVGLPEPAASVDVSDTTTVYARGSVHHGQKATYNGETAPRLDVTLDFSRVDVHLGYNPRIVLAHFAGAGDDHVWAYHVADFSVVYKAERDRFVLSELFGGGDMFMGNLLSATTLAASTTDSQADLRGLQTTARIPLISTAERVRTLSTRTTVSWIREWTPRLGSSASFYYDRSGGQGKAFETLWPLTAREVLDASLRYELTEDAYLATALNGGHMRSANGFDYYFMSVSEALSFRLSEELSARLAAGTSLRTSMAANDRSAPVTPLFGGTLSYERSHKRASLVYRVDTTLSPYPNPISGQMQTFVTGSAAIRAFALESFDLQASVDGSDSVWDGGQPGTRALGAALIATQPLASYLLINAGARLQKQQVFSANLPLQWVLSLGLTLRAPTQSF